jgi:hypothetical protein
MSVCVRGMSARDRFVQPFALIVLPSESGVHKKGLQILSINHVITITGPQITQISVHNILYNLCRLMAQSVKSVDRRFYNL